MPRGKNIAREFQELAEQWGQDDMSFDDAPWVLRGGAFGGDNRYVCEQELVDVLRPGRWDRW